MSVQVHIHNAQSPTHVLFKAENMSKYLLTVGFRARHATPYRLLNIVNVWISDIAFSLSTGNGICLAQDPSVFY